MLHNVLGGGGGTNGKDLLIEIIESFEMGSQQTRAETSDPNVLLDVYVTPYSFEVCQVQECRLVVQMEMKS